MATKIWEVNPHFWSNILKRLISLLLFCGVWVCFLNKRLIIAFLTRVGKPFQAIIVLILPTC